MCANLACSLTVILYNCNSTNYSRKAQAQYIKHFFLLQALKMQFQIDIGTTNLGFHGDKFEQAKSAWLLAFEHRDEEYKFVNDFFWSQNRD